MMLENAGFNREGKRRAILFFANKMDCAGEKYKL